MPTLPRSVIGDDEVLHTWLGVVGPRPTIVSAVSLSLVAAMFAHLFIDLPPWWPFSAGAVAIAANIGLAYWQAGTFRVVAVTENGIQVFRKARWSTECTHLLGSMPRMPLGPLEGRWCRSSVADSMIWINRKYHSEVAAFDADYLGRYGEEYAASGPPQPVPIQDD